MSFRICALDDDESILYTLEAMAGTQGWIFRGTAVVEKCLEYVERGEVDLLLLDYHMPTENGFDVLKKVKAAAPSLPVLMLTVEQDPETAEKLLLAGAEDFINKPVRLADFLSRIRLHRRLQERNAELRGDSRKGIDPNRLHKIVDFLKKKQGAAEIGEVAENCGFAYTTAHRYVDYLVKKGMAVSYATQQDGKPGRPTRSYRYTGVRKDGAK